MNLFGYHNAYRRGVMKGPADKLIHPYLPRFMRGIQNSSQSTDPQEVSCASPVNFNPRRPVVDESVVMHTPYGLTPVAYPIRPGSYQWLVTYCCRLSPHAEVALFFPY